MDRRRYSYIAHGDLTVWNPLQTLTFDDVARRLTISLGGTALDIGCGRAHWLIRAAEEFQLSRAIGVDPSAYAADAARREAADSPARSRIEIRECKFDAGAFEDDSFDLLFCVGSIHAFPSFETALRELHRLSRSGAQLILGEGYWKRTPDPAYLAFLQCDESLYTTSERICRRAAELGFSNTWYYECTNEDWSRYEGKYADNVESHVRSQSGDPDASEMLSTIRAWRNHYLRFGHDTLGFGLYMFTAQKSN